jgi:AcrR family transcriptional regulator
VPRDPERTRRAILAAALREFARVGPAGARVDRIAAEAGVNKRMLYHYFGNKAGLYRALLAEHEGPQAEASAHVSGRLAALDATFGGSPEWVRLLMWAELDRTRPPESRSPTLDPEAAQLELALQAIAIAPWAFPALAKAITGLDPSSPEFAARRAAFFAAFDRLLAGAPKPRLRLKPDVVGG